MPESRRLNRLILAGFALLLLLMLGWGAHTLWQIRQLAAHMDDLVQERNLKIQLATDLQEASYNRHNSLVYQVLIPDPFERDEMFQQFIKWGYEVGKARNDLRQLPLDEHENLNIERQDVIISNIVVLHEQISDLAARGELENARDLLTEHLRPLNLLFVTLVEDLRRHERNLVSQALDATHRSTRRAEWISLGLGGLLLSLATLIAYFTHRQFHSYSKTICGQVQLLEAVGRTLEHQATHDNLTGIANRALFNLRLEEDLTRAREEDYGLMLVYLDLDDFKPVNDQYGHAMGDALLRAVAQRLKGAVRVNDTVARLGGDEFAAICAGPGDSRQQAAICLKLELAICQPVYLGEVCVTPRISIGRAIFPEDGRSMQELINAADADMYRVKQLRKGDQAPAAEPPGPPPAPA